MTDIKITLETRVNKIFGWEDFQFIARLASDGTLGLYRNEVQFFKHVNYHYSPKK